MQSSRLGCFTGTGIFAALITTLAIAGIAFASGSQMFTAGPLNNVNEGTDVYGNVSTHAQITECKGCHAAPWEGETMADRCAKCHTDIAAQMFNVAELHGAIMDKDPNLSCRDCHPEHRGPSAPLTDLKNNVFPHDAMGFSLNGHQQKVTREAFTCQDCHPDDVTNFASDSCDSCHRQMDIVFTQAHALNFGMDCLACHDGVDRFGDDFSHNAYAFKLSGKHADVSCSRCHLDAHDLTALQSAPQDCYSCHYSNDAHQGRFGQDCAVCHTAGGWKPASFDHNLSAFKLEGEHGEAACDQCHQNGVYQGTPTDCYSCHSGDDEHNGQYGQDCAACHTPSDWDNASIDHNRFAFKLEGAHAQVRCEQCHVNNVFKGIPSDCYSCHQKDDEHNGQFGTDCSACHTAGSWEGAVFDHNLSNFPLTGAHVNLACERCHTNGQFAGLGTSCVSCHAEPAEHLGQFGTECAVCHSTTAWTPAEFTGQHTFPMNHGERGTVSCVTCHPVNYATYTCYGCHEHTESNIRGEHLEEGISDFQNCVKCHADGREHD